MRAYLYSTASVIAALSMGAMASAASANEAAATKAPAGAAAAEPQLEEIIVTALRRDQALIDVPASVDVLTEQKLESAGVRNPGQFLNMLPNVNFVQSNYVGETFVTIRGMTQTRNGESSVAVVVDGVTATNPQELNQDLGDIAQVEVLKGPQGALYGRNATGGAIVISTKRPTNDVEGKVLLGYGRFNQAIAQGAISGPLVEDKLFARASVSHSSGDGPFTNITNGEKVMRSNQNSGRLRLNWVPTDNLEVDLRMGASKYRGGGIQFFPNLGVIDANNADVVYQDNVMGQSEQERENVSLKIDYDTGFGVITSVTAWTQQNDTYASGSYPFTPGPGDGTQYHVRENDAWSEELRYSSPSDKRIRLIAGAYYAKIGLNQFDLTGLDINSTILPGVGPHGPGTSNPTTSFIGLENKNRAYAFFGHLAFDITSQVEATFALRYDNERKKQTDIAPAAFTPNPGLVRQTTFDKLQPKVTLRYSPTDTLSIFADYGIGFKTGGWNPFNTRQLLLPFNPNTNVQDIFPAETNKNFEIGFKSQLFDKRLSLNGAFFHSNVKNPQTWEFLPAISLQAISAADEVKINGFEFDFVANLAEGLDLSGSFGYTDSTVKKFDSIPQYVGNRAPYTPEYTINLAVTYTKPITENMSIFTRAEYRREGSKWWDFANTEGSRRDPIDIVDARLGLQGETWSATAWVRNLTNKAYFAEVIVLLPGLASNYRAEPRTFGFEVIKRF